MLLFVFDTDNNCKTPWNISIPSCTTTHRIFLLGVNPPAKDCMLYANLNAWAFSCVLGIVMVLLNDALRFVMSSISSIAYVTAISNSPIKSNSYWTSWLESFNG